MLLKHPSRGVVYAAGLMFACAVAPAHAEQQQAQLFVSAQVVEGVRVDTAAAGQRGAKAWTTNANRAVVEKLSTVDCGGSAKTPRTCKRLELIF